MKKLFVLVMILVIAMSSQVFAAERVDATIKLDGKLVRSGDLMPYIETGVTMVPLRWVSENLGREVTWDQETYSAGIDTNLEVYKEDLTKLDNGIVNVLINGNIMKNETALRPQIVSSTTFVPLRPLSEALGLGIEWDDETKTVLMESKPAMKDSISSQYLALDRAKDFTLMFKEGSINLYDILNDVTLLDEFSAEVTDGGPFGRPGITITKVIGINGINYSQATTDDYESLKTFFDGNFSDGYYMNYVVTDESITDDPRVGFYLGDSDSAFSWAEKHNHME